MSLINTALAARAFVQDMSGMCDRNPGACAVGRDAIDLVAMKVGTGFDIVTASISATRDGLNADARPADRGTLTAKDMEIAWSFEPR